MIGSIFASMMVMVCGATPEGLDMEGIEAFCAGFVPDARPEWGAERMRRYMGLYDSGIEKMMESFNFETGLRDLDGERPPAEVAGLDRNARKVYAQRPEYLWIYALGRRSASDIGAFALAWALPGSRFHQDARLLQGVVRGLNAYLEHQLPSGEFAFSSIRTSSCYGTHEMAWRLEPLLAAYLCVRHELPRQEAERIREGLVRAADYLYENRNSSQSNRGAVWCGVMAAASVALNRPEYVEGMRENWDWVGGRVLAESGEVIEGPGPDMGYSYITLLYAFRQREALGRQDLDERLSRSLEWFTTMHDDWGIPFQSVSTRTNRFDPEYLSYLIGALEFYARQKPYLGTIAGDYLAILEREEGAPVTSHGGIPWVTAALLHSGEVGEEEVPDSLRHYTTYYSYDVTKYITIGRTYRTLLSFSGVFDYSGLQHWGAAGEPPVLCEGRQHASGTLAWGVDRSRFKVGKGRGHWTRDETDLVTVIIDWDGLRDCYVLGEKATWVLNVGPGMKREIRWVMNGKVCPAPQLRGHEAFFPGVRSRIEMGPGEPELRREGEDWLLRAVVPEEEPVYWTVFSTGEMVSPSLSYVDGVVQGLVSEAGARYGLAVNLGTTPLQAGGASVRPGHAAAWWLGDE